MRKTTKKGFTIVELVIVIAVIAILAAVLLPTFSNIIRKAQISADVQLCKNLNTVLATAEAEGRVPGSMYDVLYLENEAGYILANLNPTADGMYYAWDQKTNKILYLQSDLETVYYPEDYTLNAGNCWVTVGSAAEATTVSDKGFNLALEGDIEDEIVLHNVVSVNTLGFKAGNLTMTTGAKDVEEAKLIGQFGATNISAGASSVTALGTVNSLSVTGTAATKVTIGGSVTSFSAGSGVSSTVSSTGMVSSIASTSAGTITNNGVVKANDSSSAITGNSVGTTVGNVVAASTKEDLDSIRTQVATGARNFKDETVKLSGDINLNGIAMTPISNFSRDDKNTEVAFSGTFDGNGYTIKNFSTNGFSITGLNAGTNSSTPAFGESNITYNETVYGLFGTVCDATIKNVNITCDIDMVLDNANHYVGDSVGGIVGCAYGNTVFENCTVNGTIKGYDGVGGLLGRLKGGSVTFINCTNNATVTGVRKTGGFIGSSYKGAYSVTYTNCVNNGNVTCLGIEKDIELGCRDSKGNFITGTPETKNCSGYYTASASNGEYASANFVAGSSATSNSVTVNSFTNNGKIMVGSVDVGNGTYFNATTGKTVKGN